MGKTTRKNLHKIRYADFDDYHKCLYGDFERSLASFGRSLTKSSQENIVKSWKRAGRDGQEGFKTHPRQLKTVPFDKTAAKTIARQRTKHALKRAIKDGNFDDILTPTRRDEKAKALADIFY